MNSRISKINIILTRNHTSVHNLNIAYVLFAIYLVLYTIFSLTIIKLQIFPLIKRITYFDVAVEWSVTGTLEQDIFLTLMMYSVLILIIFKKYVSVPISILMIVPAIFVITGETTNYQNFVEFIFFSSFPLLASLLALDKFFRNQLSYSRFGVSTKTQFTFKFHKFLVVFFLTLLGIEIIVLSNWVIHPPLFNLSTVPWSWKLNDLDNDLFFAFGLLSSSLMILSIFSFLIKPFIPNFSTLLEKLSLSQKADENQKSILKNFEVKVKNRFSINLAKPFQEANKRIGDLSEGSSNHLLLVFFIAIVPSVLLPLYAYDVAANPDSLLGTDIHAYIEAMNFLSLSSSDPSAFLYQLFAGYYHGDRPLTFLILYSTTVLSEQSSQLILKLLPIVLGPILVLAIYFLVSHAYPGSRGLAVLAAILTAVSHQIIIGFYAAYYANWLALIIMSICSIFLLKSINNQNPFKNIVFFAVLTTMLLLFHSHTWTYFSAVVLLFLCWSSIQAMRAKKNIKIFLILGIVTIAIIGADVVKSFYLGSPSGFGIDLITAEQSIGYEKFAERWQNLNTTFKVNLGGFLTNFSMLLFLFMWSLNAKYNNLSDRFFLSFLFVALLPVLFGDFLIQSRIFYLIPIQIPVSIILYKIYTNSKIAFAKPLVLVVIFMQFNYALRAMANMQFELP